MGRTERAVRMCGGGRASWRCIPGRRMGARRVERSKADQRGTFYTRGLRASALAAGCPTLATTIYTRAGRAGTPGQSSSRGRAWEGGVGQARTRGRDSAECERTNTCCTFVSLPPRRPSPPPPPPPRAPAESRAPVRDTGGRCLCCASAR